MVQAGACVIYQPPDDSDPPTLLVSDGSHSVLLMPPTNLDDYEDFRRFLRELAEGATELLLDCHPALAWGRRVFSSGAGQPAGRD